MARLRIAEPAKADLKAILETSEARWGIAARRRYRALLAAEPVGPLSRRRDELAPGLYSFHVRHARDGSAGDRVANPVHILYYRAAAPGLVEIVRVLHERADPVRHVGAEGEG